MKITYILVLNDGTKLIVETRTKYEELKKELKAEDRLHYSYSTRRNMGLKAPDNEEIIYSDKKMEL